MTGRTVLVTGGSRGIGRAIAEAFVAVGDQVTVTSRSPETSSDGAVQSARLDMEDLDSIGKLAERFPGGVDVLVNNAGGFAQPAPGAEAPLSEVADYWQRNLQVNLVGAALLVSALEDRIRHGGRIVSIGSIGAEYAGNPYSVAKAALQAWTAGLAQAFGPRDITVNAVSPGYVEGTELFGGAMSEVRRASLIERTHVKRAGTPTDVAEAVAFLASRQARHVTGQTIHVNGGAFSTR